MSKPRFRPQFSHDLRASVYNAVEVVIEESFVYTSCMNCINFREHQSETCGLTNPLIRPPARIIAYGCPQWEDKDEIPF